MLKIRLQGTIKEINWYKQVLKVTRGVKLLEFSKPFANKGTNKHFRVYAEIEETSHRLECGDYE